MTYYLGVDCSTTATKALLMGEDGAVVGVGRAGYGYETPHPLWAEQSPDLWWKATASAIQSVLAEHSVAGADIAAVGLTGQMHGLVLLGEHGDVLRPSILWNDQRSQAECDEIRARVGRSRLIQTTGNDALTGFTASKILWVRNNEPELYKEVAKILLPKDYVRYRLTGDLATDRAGASGTALFDLATRDWSRTVLDALDISPSLLPTTHEGTEITGVITRRAAAETGLRPGTPVIAGAGDQAANGVGVGAIAPGLAAMSIGTSGVVFTATNRPIVEPEGRLHSFCHAVPGAWHLMGVMLSAAGSYQWFRDRLASSMSFAELDEAAAGIRPGSDGLVFLPYLSGERTPHPDPLARGGFVGLTIRHGVGNLARAVLEGVAFGLRDSIELMESATNIDEVRVSGGGASSTLWMQILADVVGKEMQRVGTPESAAHGAAILSAVGVGGFGSVGEACDSAVELGEVFEPGAAARVYEDVYRVYRDLYPALEATFHRLSAPGD